MTIYSVSNGIDFDEDFYTLREAKKAMKEHNAKGWKTKIYSNGDWEPCGEISLTGSNATLMSGATRQTKENYS